MSASQRTPRSNARSLTIRQKKVLETIQRSVSANGYPPSMREIGDAVGLASLSSVTHQLSQLEKLGYIRRDPRRPRAMEILLPLQLKGDAKLEVVEGQDSLKAANGMNVSELTTSADTAMVPLVGRIAAGGPILADQ